MKTQQNDDEKYRFSQVEEKEYADQRKYWFSPTGKPEPKSITIPFWEAVCHYLHEWRLIWRWRASNTKDGFWEWRRKQDQ